MRELLPTLRSWSEAGEEFAVAFVVQTWGSSPRPFGSAMAVRADGLVIGSVSGGCVEAEVITACAKARAEKRALELDFGPIQADLIWKSGLSCGGQIRVWIVPDWSLSSMEWEGLALHGQELEISLASSAPRLVPTASAPEEGWLRLPNPRLDQLLIIGASHISIPLIQFAQPAGFETWLIDPRAQLLRPERFPVLPDHCIEAIPGSLLESWDWQGQWYAVTLSHDPKVDEAAIRVLLRAPIVYLGALGSRKTQAERNERLSQEGFSEEELGRIHGPVGLAIGARSPEEIAISILAELIQVRHAN